MEPANPSSNQRSRLQPTQAIITGHQNCWVGRFPGKRLTGDPEDKGPSAVRSQVGSTLIQQSPTVGQAEGCPGKAQCHMDSIYAKNLYQEPTLEEVIRQT